MAIEISQHLREVINNPESLKVLATVSKEGEPHVVFKGSLFLAEDGILEYNEIIESSQTNKNLVHSLWFNKTVSINVLLGKESFQIKGKIDRALISGREFEKRYNALQKIQDTDLSTVWRIIPEEVREQNLEKRRNKELSEHPILQHLDRLTKQEIQT